MRYVFLSKGWEDYQHWMDNDRQMLRRLNRLIMECNRTPFDGIGKPEPLRDDFAGWWSRRIDDEHRLVYRVNGDDLIIAQCRYHYHK
ncbi:MAG: toxin YoeB [Devosia sp.]|uniref:Txe/YoeB family addiction module toxin n=1 Tax=Devosia sp. TaxID=1871048 RepID=UPI00261478E1|nr:Txe/YoeB family addiction module toxin [Devosia sp.]MDB5539582.1 toxin YoeB [Devosia sp.]